jgi:hypothetical protein
MRKRDKTHAWQSNPKDETSGGGRPVAHLGEVASALDFELEVWAVAVAGEELEDVGGGADDDDAGGHHGEVRLELLVRRLLARTPRDRAEEHLDHFSSPDQAGGEGAFDLRRWRGLNPRLGMILGGLPWG